VRGAFSVDTLQTGVVRHAFPRARHPMQSRQRLKCNEGGAIRPHCSVGEMSASDLSGNHRDDSQRAGINDKNLVAD
jgi:hypothetical protein